ncbi:Histone acetyltransferase mst1 [Elsinoe australis]|uniref:Histone acetyltransferase mst1 n=1 Tax=Elsinoe australis TaxID=40998 RepID=A0A2P7YC23_9PEZI|nr:Histone acetyltransferase mst1 [Elsinoe australis]
MAAHHSPALQVQPSNPMEDLWWNKLALPPHMEISSIRADETSSMIKDGVLLQDFVRHKSDGIIFLVDAREQRSEHSSALPYYLKKFVSRIRETEDSPLLVLLDNAEEEETTPVHVLQETVRKSLIAQNRGSQCYYEQLTPGPAKDFGQLLDWPCAPSASPPSSSTAKASSSSASNAPPPASSYLQPSTSNPRPPSLSFLTLAVFAIVCNNLGGTALLPTYHRLSGFLTGTQFDALTVLNSMSFFGDALPGFAADRVERFNTLACLIVLTLVTMEAVWLPFGAGSEVALYTVVCLFRSSSGGWVSLSLSPVCAGQLCRTEEYRTFYRTLHFSDEHRKRDNVPVSGQLVHDDTEGVGGVPFGYALCGSY